MNDASEIGQSWKFTAGELEWCNAGVICPPETDLILDHADDCQPANRRPWNNVIPPGWRLFVFGSLSENP